MKISKLFHWLYTFLMFIPVLYILANALYYIFNDNATISSINDVFMVSLNNVYTSTFFSWCNTSFLVAPFSYITNLFGMPSNNSIITLLSYWCNISIIWLTFDVVLYVPLLIHRWLDKGVIE